MRILMPLDGSPFAEDALGLVATLANRAKEPMDVQLLQVISLTALTMRTSEIAIAHAIEFAEAEARAYLRAVAERPSRHYSNVTVRVVTSPLGVAETITTQARMCHSSSSIQPRQRCNGIALAHRQRTVGDAQWA